MSSQLDNAVELIKESLPKRLDDISIDPISNTLLSDLLRGMVSIKLFLERKYYLRHPYIVTKQTLFPDRNIFAICLTNSSAVNIKNTIENHILCIINKSISNCNKGCWMNSMEFTNMFLSIIQHTSMQNNVSLSHDFYKFHGIVQWHCRIKG